jgi:hypothetical protein
MNLLSELNEIIKRLNDEKVDYALCGGLAVAIYGFVRATEDIDLLILLKDIVKIKNILLNNGYTIEANPITFQSDKVKIERITKIDQKKGDAISVDLLLVTPEIEKVWDSIQTLIWNGMELSIVSKQGLIDLKKLRNSKQDQADIEYLMKEL